ncbi:TonB-dependent receptor plug domain-containing protein [Lysobacter tyrosinilyticus]
MTFKTTKLRDAISFALVVGTTAAAGTGVAYAQDAEQKEATTLDRVEVTGSRIPRAEIETAQPIITLSREDIQQQGFTSVADILQNLTSAGSPAISRSQALASGESVGGYYIDIRNLGANRTLVLVNGKRIGATTDGLQDLGQIPVSAIQRIEILKDGASSIYGSDAIAGVVNVITRRQFDGAEANAYVGQFSEGDGEKQSYDMTIGATGEKASVTLSAEFTKEDPVMAKDRAFSSGLPAGSPVSYVGSANLPCGPGGAVVKCTLRPGMNPKLISSYRPYVPGVPFSPTNPGSFGDNANSNEEMFLQTGIERRSLYITGMVDITDNLRFTSDFSYNKRTTDQQIAGYPYQSTSFGTPMSGASFFTPTPGTALNFQRRLWEVPRTTESNLETYRWAGGLEGFFSIGDHQWDWDVGANINRNDSVKKGHGDASLLATTAALGPSYFNPTTQRVECGSLANPIDYGTNIGNGECIPWNPLAPFGDTQAGSLTGNADLQAFLFPEFTDTGRTESHSYTASVAGSLFALPAGDLGLAVGVEHRSEEGVFVPDAFRQSANSTGLPATTTQGQYDLDEIYAEIEIPVLADMAFAKELTFNISSRYSDYSNFGDTTNSKFSLRWRPMDDLLVRGTYAEGFRAPAISDLFGGLSGTFAFYIDPCGVNSPNGTVNGTPACAGVPVGYVQQAQGGANCTQYPCQTPDQFLSGSNPNLLPENSKSKTAGLVWSPHWVEGLDISLDWYNYEITNAIQSDDATDILADCYVTGITQRCTDAHVTRAADGHVTNMFIGLANVGKIETEGYDLGVNYKLPEFSFGKFVIDWQNSYTSKYDKLTKNPAGDDVMLGHVGEPGIFRIRSNLGVTWQKGDFGVSYMARYYSSMKEPCATGRPCNDDDRIVNGRLTRTNVVGSNTFHDIQAYVKLPWNATAAIGANNVGNHVGPMMYSAPSANFAYYGGFDIGRTIYLKYQQRF